jgi:hypothetical protein
MNPETKHRGDVGFVPGVQPLDPVDQFGVCRGTGSPDRRRHTGTAGIRKPHHWSMR